MATQETSSEVPKWLTKLEEQRERRLKAKLGHETGAGAPCLTCGDTCPGLDLHFWRKICKNCKCGKESHDVIDDDIYGYAQFKLLGSKPIKGKKIVLPGKKEAVDLEWAPKGATVAVEKYLGELPPELLPVKGTEAAQLRKQRLLKQMPAHDVDPTLCHALTEDEIAKFLEYVAHIKQNSVGQGHITQLSLLRGHIHHMRQANDQLVAQKLAGDMSTSQSAILHPYSKADALTKKVQLQLTLNSNNPQSAQYPDEDQQYPTQDPMRMRDLSYDANLNNKHKRTGIYSNSNESAESILEETGSEFGTANPYKQGTLPHYAVGSFKSYENTQNPVNVGPVRDFAYDVNVNPATRMPSGAFDTYGDAAAHYQHQYNPQGYKGSAIQRPTELNIGSQRRYAPEYTANPNLNISDYPQNPIDSDLQSVPFPHGDISTAYDNQRNPNTLHSQPLNYNPNANLDSLGRLNHAQEGYSASMQGIAFPHGDNAMHEYRNRSGDNSATYDNQKNPNALHSQPLNYNPNANLDSLGRLNQAQEGYNANIQGIAFPGGDNAMHDYRNRSANDALQTHTLRHNNPNANPEDPSQINAGDMQGGFDNSGFAANNRNPEYAKGTLPARFPNQAFNPNSNANVSEYQQDPSVENVGPIHDLNYPVSDIRAAVYHNEDLEAPNLPATDPKDLDNSNLFEQIPACHKCNKMFEPDEIVISIERTNALWHTDCFKCEACNQILADLVYFYHKKTDTIYCGRDYAKIKGIPRCSACDELIFVQEYCLAENCTFHIKHFCCFECDTPLAGQNYVMEGSQPLCLPCFDTCKAAKCNTCKTVIHPDQQGAMVKDVHFHVTPECFACKQCKKSLIGAKLLLKNDNLFCSAECFQKHG